MICGPLVVTVASNWSICAPNCVLIRPRPAITKPRIAAGPITANAILATEVIPFAIVAMADKPVLAAPLNALAMPELPALNLAIPADATPNALPIVVPDVCALTARPPMSFPRLPKCFIAGPKANEPTKPAIAGIALDAAALSLSIGSILVSSFLASASAPENSSSIFFLVSSAPNAIW